MLFLCYWTIVCCVYLIRHNASLAHFNLCPAVVFEWIPLLWNSKTIIINFIYFSSSTVLTFFSCHLIRSLIILLIKEIRLLFHGHSDSTQFYYPLLIRRTYFSFRNFNSCFFFCQLKLTLFTQKESHSLNEPLLYLHVVSLYSNSECVSVLTTVHCI